ncbi:hypothetical protein L2E82_15337 [Cichorium intybus]|uniref:Uncharacterized protein n=1 Tax=Cichorium intybus TaxID=13427 RepID=A0ACB9F2I2_CICIN|nr:hypothetical protein L2E82_15337 [Cichorium intybus]
MLSTPFSTSSDAELDSSLGVSSELRAWADDDGWIETVDYVFSNKEINRRKAVVQSGDREGGVNLIDSGSFSDYDDVGGFDDSPNSSTRSGWLLMEVVGGGCLVRE